MAYIKKIMLSLAVAAMLFSCKSGNDKVVDMLIPQPAKTIIKSGSFSCEAPVVYFSNVAEADKENLMELIKGVFPLATERSTGGWKGLQVNR